VALAAAAAASIAAGCDGDSGGGPPPVERLLGSNIDGNYAQLVEIESATGAARALTGGGILGCDEIRAIAWSAELGMLYGFDWTLQELVWIDPATGNVERLAPSIGFSVRDLAVRDRVLFGIDSNDTLVRFDANDRPVAVGSGVGFSGVESLAYDAAGDRLVGCDNQTDALVAIDPFTGVGTSIGALGIVGNPNITSMFEDPATGDVYATTNQTLFRVDTATGQATSAGVFDERIFCASAGPDGAFLATETDISGGNGKSLLRFVLPLGSMTRGPSLGIERTDTLVPLPSGGVAFTVDAAQRRTRLVDLATGRSSDVGPSVFLPGGLSLTFERDAIVGTSSADLAELDTTTGLLLPSAAHGLLAVTGTNTTKGVCDGLRPGRFHVTSGTWLAEFETDGGALVAAFDTGIAGLSGIDREPGTQRLRALSSSGLSYLVDPETETVELDERLFPASLTPEALVREPGTSNWLALSNSTQQLLRRRPDGRVEGVGCFGLGTIDGLASDPEARVAWAVTVSSGVRSLVRIEKGGRTEYVGDGSQLVLPGALFDIAWVPARGRLYGAAQTSPRILVEIDPATGIATELGTLARQVVIGETDGTVLFGIDSNTDELVAIDIDTRVITTIGPLGSPTLGGLARSPVSGDLFAVDAQADVFVRIDPTTAQTTVVSRAPYRSSALTLLPW